MSPLASMLERESTALLVVDIQERLAAVMERRAGVLAKAGLLIEVAGILGIPVIATRQYPKGLGELEPYLESRLQLAEKNGSRVVRIDKLSFDCFRDPAFCDAVTSLDRGQLLVTGIEAHICVSQTALSALREGYDVHVASDGCCSIDDECRTSALDRLARAGGVVTTCESASYELVGSAEGDDFKQLLQAVKRCAAGF